MAELEQRYDQWVNHGLLIFPEQPKPALNKASQTRPRQKLVMPFA